MLGEITKFSLRQRVPHNLCVAGARNGEPENQAMPTFITESAYHAHFPLIPPCRYRQLPSTDYRLHVTFACLLKQQKAASTTATSSLARLRQLYFTFRPDWFRFRSWSEPDAQLESRTQKAKRRRRPTSVVSRQSQSCRRHISTRV